MKNFDVTQDHFKSVQVSVSYVKSEPKGYSNVKSVKTFIQIKTVNRAQELSDQTAPLKSSPKRERRLQLKPC